MIITRALGVGKSSLRVQGELLCHSSWPSCSSVTSSAAPFLLTRTVAQRSLPIVTRQIQIESIPANSQEILNRQRLRRPSSPHFTIYQPQLTWIGSIAHRMTGVGLSVGLYGFLLAYLAAPVVGIPLDSAHIVDFVHGVPEWIKYTAKGIIALPFTFHSLNGLRHLSWDLGKFLTVKGAYRSGYTVIAASVASTVALVLL